MRRHPEELPMDHKSSAECAKTVVPRRCARAGAVELAWIWLRNQPESKLSRWFAETTEIGPPPIEGMARRLETRRHEGSDDQTQLAWCHLYARLDRAGLEQDFNSLDAQREASEAYIKSQAHEGWRLIRDRYDDGGNGSFGRSSDGLALITKNSVDPGAVSCRVAGMSDAVIHRHFGEVEWAHAFEASDVDAVLSRVGAALVMRVDAAFRAKIVLRRHRAELIEREAVGASCHDLEVVPFGRYGDGATHPAIGAGAPAYRVETVR
jgi:hypothetical protein